VQFYGYFVSQSSEFCRHNHLCCFSTSNTKGKRIFGYDSVRKLFDTPSNLVWFLNKPTVNPWIQFPPRNPKVKKLPRTSRGCQYHQRNSSTRTELFWNRQMRPVPCRTVLTNSWNAEILITVVIDLSLQFVEHRSLIFWQHPPLDPFLFAGLMNVLTHATVLRLIPFAFQTIFANATGKYSTLKINFPHSKLTSTSFKFLLTAVCPV